MNLPSNRIKSVLVCWVLAIFAPVYAIAELAVDIIDYGDDPSIPNIAVILVDDPTNPFMKNGDVSDALMSVFEKNENYRVPSKESLLAVSPEVISDADISVLRVINVDYFLSGEFMYAKSGYWEVTYRLIEIVTQEVISTRSIKLLSAGDIDQLAYAVDRCIGYSEC